jgi:hypothetical protein
MAAILPAQRASAFEIGAAALPPDAAVGSTLILVAE